MRGGLLALLFCAAVGARQQQPEALRVDRLLSALERGGGTVSDRAGELRKRRKAASPTLYDAAAAGGLCGWLCGKLLVGDPTLMAIAGSSACIFAVKKQPDNRYGNAANRLTAEFHSLRVSVADRLA
ncbi:hypothetical protein T492DRAFT_1075291 [Pavlovales sp. CCMP2436]|nr:hypothetical protein T492DRAFT_1075291 [Pavlovales sp. CCMP2436]|eukprot:CAMPEP_0180023684 /NCGR_PEP_ID=MMETSP0984-20121128/23664_1 /TAXON_ID=483367 /ORGANISM="non described non described, Strain CCMP 2436" /LENGTH=126 /DNA_ID=CAMNT_0021948087 /DNA_START=1 /DNA_END=381 /DNA_ORIENTATION=+